jgi:ankyrin repeat protein
MATSYFHSRLFHSLIARLAAVLLTMLPWSVPAFSQLRPHADGEMLKPTEPIHDAAKAGDLAKVKALLKDNTALITSKDNNTGWTPLHIAARWGHKDVVEFLLANRANVNAKGGIDSVTPLHLAARNGDKNVVESLLANGAEVDAKNSANITPLHVAAQNGHMDVANLLLANKADVNGKNNFGNSPLHDALRLGYKDVAELLRQHGGHE